MRYAMLTGLAAVAALAMAAQTPAEAQTWRKYVDAYTGKSSNLNSRIQRRIDSALNRARKYRKDEDTKTAKEPASTVAALSNSRRKCLDGTTAGCPQADSAADSP